MYRLGIAGFLCLLCLHCQAKLPDLHGFPCEAQSACGEALRCIKAPDCPQKPGKCLEPKEKLPPDYCQPSEAGPPEPQADASRGDATAGDKEPHDPGKHEAQKREPAPDTPAPDASPPEPNIPEEPQAQENPQENPKEGPREPQPDAAPPDQSPLCSPPGKAEVCNGKDDDCDGAIDELLSKPCAYKGPTNTEGVGRCKAGAQSCEKGAWSSCQGEVAPAAQELCHNGIDDDCDGSVDEGCSPCLPTTLSRYFSTRNAWLYNSLAVRDDEQRLYLALSNAIYEYDAKLRPLRTHHPAAGLPIALQVTASGDGLILLTDSSLRVLELKTQKTRHLWSWRAPVIARSGQISADRRYVAAGFADGSLRVWDLVAGKKITDFKAHPSETWEVAFHPNQKLLVSASLKANELRFWSYPSGKAQGQAITLPALPKALSFHPHQALLLAGTQAGLRIVDLKSGTHRLLAQTQSLSYECAGYFPDGKRFYSCSSRNFLQLWDSQSESKLQELFHNTRVRGAWASRKDPDVLWTAATALRRWSASKGSLLQTAPTVVPLSTINAFSAVALSVADQSLAIGGHTQGSIERYVPKAGQPSGGPPLAFKGQGHKAAVVALAYGPAGKHLLSGSRAGDVRIWDVATQSSKRLLPKSPGATTHSGFVTRVAYSPDGRWLASGGGDSNVHIWDAKTHAPLRTISTPRAAIDGLAFSHHGSWIAASVAPGYSLVHVYETQSGKQLRSFAGSGLHCSSYQCLGFSHDDKWLAFVGKFSVEVRDTTHWNIAHSLSRSGYKAYSVQFHPKQPWIAVGYEDGLLEWWDLSQKTARKLPATLQLPNVPNWIAFSPTGDRLYAATRFELMRWDCPCKAGNKRACFTGPPGAAGQGICKAGSQTCAAGQWGPCTHELIPQYTASCP